MVLGRHWKRMVVGLVLAFGASLQGCRAEQSWPLWQSYRAKFIDVQQGRVIDPMAHDKTTSEGQVYAMFFALVVNDQPGFDKLLHWTEDNLAQGDLTAHLPAWSWGKADDGRWHVLDTNSASDADLWLAYDLLEAGRLWKIDRYEKLGAVLSTRIAQSEVNLAPNLGTVLLPGHIGFQHEGTSFVLNPSYTPLQVLARLSLGDPNGPWSAIADSYPQILARGSANGFAMDWVAAGAEIRPSPTPTELAQGKQDAVPIGSYDAIRVYLWLGMADAGTRSVASSLKAVSGMSHYMTNHPIPPLQVDGSGKILNDSGTIGFSAAVIPYLMASQNTRAAAQQKDRLAASLQDGLYGRSPAYYDQNLALFSFGWMEKRFRFDRSGCLKVPWK